MSKLLVRLGFSADSFLIPLAALIGAAAGLVATGFDLLVRGAGWVFFGGLGHPTLSIPDWLWILFLPAIGGLVVGFIQQYLSRTGPSHGIPEVVESLARQHGRIPARVGFWKMITASLTIGSGGSAGVEGPIIQIGSVVGSVVARTLRVSHEHMHTLVGCGAAGGMAGIFNAPIAGVLFVLEVLLRDFSIKTFMPIVIASVFGTTVAQALLGHNVAVFTIPEAMRGYEFTMGELPPYAVLGVLCGLLGVGFLFAMRRSGALWEESKLPAWIKPGVGGLMLGVTGVVFVMVFKNPIEQFKPPVFFANGYPVIEALLAPVSYVQHAASIDAEMPVMHATIGLLLAALVFKLLGTCLTIGSGGSGGVLAPSLFLGATLGGIVGLLLRDLGLYPGLNPATFALAGMAGVLAATVHCPLTAFLLVFEITQDYKVILPTMLVAILATTCSQFFTRDSIYSAWLRKRGVAIGTTADLTQLRRLEARDVNLVPAVVVHPEEPAARLVELAEDYAAVDFAVCNEENCYVGMVVGEDLRTTLVQREAIPLMIVGELMRTNLPTVSPDETLDTVLDKFSRHEVSSLAVLDERDQVRGLITRSRLMRRYQRRLRE